MSEPTWSLGTSDMRMSRVVAGVAGKESEIVVRMRVTDEGMLEVIKETFFYDVDGGGNRTLENRDPLGNPTREAMTRYVTAEKLAQLVADRTYLRALLESALIQEFDFVRQQLDTGGPRLDGAKGFGVTSGDLPVGMGINPVLGSLEGVPRVPGDYSFEVGVIKAAGDGASAWNKQLYDLSVSYKIKQIQTVNSYLYKILTDDGDIYVTQLQDIPGNNYLTSGAGEAPAVRMSVYNNPTRIFGQTVKAVAMGNSYQAQYIVDTNGDLWMYGRAQDIPANGLVPGTITNVSLDQVLVPTKLTLPNNEKVASVTWISSSGVLVVTQNNKLYIGATVCKLGSNGLFTHITEVGFSELMLQSPVIDATVYYGPGTHQGILYLLQDGSLMVSPRIDGQAFAPQQLLAPGLCSEIFFSGYRTSVGETYLVNSTDYTSFVRVAGADGMVYLKRLTQWGYLFLDESDGSLHLFATEPGTTGFTKDQFYALNMTNSDGLDNVAISLNEPRQELTDQAFFYTRNGRLAHYNRTGIDANETYRPLNNINLALMNPAEVVDGIITPPPFAGPGMRVLNRESLKKAWADAYNTSTHVGRWFPPNATFDIAKYSDRIDRSMILPRRLAAGDILDVQMSVQHARQYATESLGMALFLSPYPTGTSYDSNVGRINVESRYPIPDEDSDKKYVQRWVYWFDTDGIDHRYGFVYGENGDILYSQYDPGTATKEPVVTVVAHVNATSLFIKVLDFNATIIPAETVTERNRLPYEPAGFRFDVHDPLTTIGGFYNRGVTLGRFAPDQRVFDEYELMTEWAFGTDTLPVPAQYAGALVTMSTTAATNALDLQVVDAVKAVAFSSPSWTPPALPGWTAATSAAFGSVGGGNSLTVIAERTFTSGDYRLPGGAIFYAFVSPVTGMALLPIWTTDQHAVDYIPADMTGPADGVVMTYTGALENNVVNLYDITKKLRTNTEVQINSDANWSNTPPFSYTGSNSFEGLPGETIKIDIGRVAPVDKLYTLQWVNTSHQSNDDYRMSEFHVFLSYDGVTWVPAGEEQTFSDNNSLYLRTVVAKFRSSADFSHIAIHISRTKYRWNMVDLCLFHAADAYRPDPIRVLGGETEIPSDVTVTVTNGTLNSGGPSIRVFNTIYNDFDACSQVNGSVHYTLTFPFSMSLRFMRIWNRPIGDNSTYGVGTVMIEAYINNVWESVTSNTDVSSICQYDDNTGYAYFQHMKYFEDGLFKNFSLEISHDVQASQYRLIISNPNNTSINIGNIVIYA